MDQILHRLKIPMIALGTSVFPANPNSIESAIESALEVGYHHFDGAYMYQTEKSIGNAIQKWLGSSGSDTLSNKGRNREDLFIVSKLPPIGMHPSRVSLFLEKSLKDLQLSYVDLYLLHWPIGIQYDAESGQMATNKDGNMLFDMTTDIIAVWKEMEKLVDVGKVKAIGLSNFNAEQIERILKICRIKPITNQVEMSPYFQQRNLKSICELNGIFLTAYYTLGGVARKDYPPEWQIEKIAGVLQDETITKLAVKYGKTPGQIIVRFFTQMGVVVIVRSCNRQRQLENLNSLSFELGTEDMELLKGLDKGDAGRTLFGFPGSNAHPEYPF